MPSYAPSFEHAPWMKTSTADVLGDVMAKYKEAGLDLYNPQHHGPLGMVNYSQIHQSPPLDDMRRPHPSQKAGRPLHHL
jgi:hypothetical protein